MVIAMAQALSHRFSSDNIRQKIKCLHLQAQHSYKSSFRWI